MNRRRGKAQPSSGALPPQTRPTGRGTPIHMKRTNVVLDEDLLEEAVRVSGGAFIVRATCLPVIQDVLQGFHLRVIYRDRVLAKLASVMPFEHEDIAPRLVSST